MIQDVLTAKLVGKVILTKRTTGLTVVTPLTAASPTTPTSPTDVLPSEEPPEPLVEF